MPNVKPTKATQTALAEHQSHKSAIPNCISNVMRDGSRWWQGTGGRESSLLLYNILWRDLSRLGLYHRLQLKALCRHSLAYPFPEDPIISLLTRFSTRLAEDDDDKIQEAQGEILDLVFDVGWQKFRAIAPPIPKRDSSHTIYTKSLHSDLNPETFYFSLVATKGHAEIVQTPPPPPRFNPFYLNQKDDTLDLPSYSSRDIR